MKLICSGNELSDAVAKVFKAVSVKATNPILEGIKLTATSGTLTLQATDVELFIEKSIVCDVKIEGETVVPGKFFYEFVRKLNRQQIELILDEKNRLKIKYGDSEGVLQCLNASEFPKIQTLGEGQSFTIKRNEFKDLVNKTAFSVCQDDSRPMLKGVLLEIKENTLTGVALDGYRLAKCIKRIEKASALMSAVVSHRCITETAKLIEDTLDPITLTIEKNYLKVNLEHTQIICRLLEGDFINYNQIIPKDFNSVVVIPCTQFKEALERAILLSRIDKNNLVKFDINCDTMIISSNSEIGNVQEKITVKLKGPDISIAFNAKYFTEILNYIQNDTLLISFTNSVSPCIVRPDNVEEEIMYLILPVRMIN